RTDGLCDTCPVRPGFEFGDRNPVCIGLCQRIHQEELIFLARLQTGNCNLQQVDHSERVDRNRSRASGVCAGWRQHYDMERLTRPTEWRKVGWPIAVWHRARNIHESLSCVPNWNVGDHFVA